MAFNFNWSPLAADAEFYSRAKDLLTTALNKSPKPPIIVDDILVNELNLGSVPPELEILEIGDLAEDRFRGIFKMCYSGDAYLTLKTRVQANPLNTYLYSKPSFASPQPLAAASGLTIPLQITLSEIKLSAFIILVFSRQKGLTLVFRNDPLESLKVSSTFDSIPFVREYLQKEIEIQLRTLMMDELPAIIHRLSLRLWCPDYGPKEEEELAQSGQKRKQQDVVDPLASPPQDAVDAYGNVFDSSEISALSLDGGAEIHSLFSQKNMLRLAALGDSQRTLSLFTPSIRDAVFRAWAGPSERSDGSSSGTPSLVRSHSASGSCATACSFSDSELPSPSSLVNLHSATTGLSLGAGRHSRSHGRKKKIRVVNLRRPKASVDLASESGDSASSTDPSIVGGSEAAFPTCIPEEHEELTTPHCSPNNRVRLRPREDSIDLGESPRILGPVIQSRPLESPRPSVSPTTQENLASVVELPALIVHEKSPELPLSFQSRQSASERNAWTFPSEKSSNITNVPSTYTTSHSQYYHAPSSGVIEQALLKIASEIVRRAGVEKSQPWESRSEREGTPPPAYEIQ